MREIMICIAVTTIINWWIAAAFLKKWRKADAEKISKAQDAVERQFKWEWSHREKELKENADEIMHEKILDIQKETVKTTAAGVLSMISEKYGIALPEPPLGARIGADGFPCSDGKGRWGDVYTFYISRNSTVFHRYPCGSLPWNRIEVNAFNLLNNNRYRPCLRCCPLLPDLNWYQEYVKAAKGVSEDFTVWIQ